MTLLKTGLLNAISVVVKMLALLGINKLLAVYVGPSGLAALGQFQNLIQIVTSVAGGAVNTGVIKYTAEYGSDIKQQARIWKAASSFAGMGSLAVSIAIVLFSRTLSEALLGASEYQTVFYWLAGGLPFFVGNILLLSILNGRKETRSYIIASISGSLLSVLISAFFVVYYGIYGAFVALAIYQSVAFFVTMLLCVYSNWFRISYLYMSWDAAILKKLSKYAAMALVSAICLPVSQVLVRDHVGRNLGWGEAGQLEAMWRLSSAYLLVVTTTLSLYYLPRLSELVCRKAIQKEIRSTSKVILPVAIVCSAAVYLLKDFIIVSLFTTDFLPMGELFLGQLVGDVLKIGSWIFAYVMLSKAVIKLYVFAEITFALTFYVLTVILFDEVGLVGVVWAHAINYLLYWFFVFGCVVCCVLRKVGDE